LLAVVPLSLCILQSTARAQSFAVDRGVWQIGGSASFSSSGGDSGERTTALSLAPRLGFFVFPGLALGAMLPLHYVSESLGHSTGYGVGPELTYYFGRGSRRLYPYVGVSALLQWTTQKYSYPDDPTTRTSTFRGQVYEANAGAAALLARNVAVTGEAFYEDRHDRYSSTGSTSRVARDSYGVRFGVTVFVY
jgi:hypothetical protein